jgi:hypothetical protein
MGRVVGYWVTTGIIAALMVFGGIMDIRLPPEMLEGARHLGYPTYFFGGLGVAKLLGVVSLVQPRLRTLQEWAYAGFTFDLIGATVTHVSVGDSAAHFMTPVVFLVVLAASYVLRKPAVSVAAQPAIA